MGYKAWVLLLSGSLHFFSSTSFKLCEDYPREITAHTLGLSLVGFLLSLDPPPLLLPFHFGAIWRPLSKQRRIRFSAPVSFPVESVPFPLRSFTWTEEVEADREKTHLKLLSDWSRLEKGQAVAKILAYDWVILRPRPGNALRNRDWSEPRRRLRAWRGVCSRAAETNERNVHRW